MPVSVPEPVPCPSSLSACGPCSTPDEPDGSGSKSYDCVPATPNLDGGKPGECSSGWDCSDGFNMRCDDGFYCSEGNCVSQEEENEGKDKGKIFDPLSSMEWTPTYSRMNCDLEQCPTCHETYSQTAFEWGNRFHYCPEPYKVSITKNIMSCTQSDIEGTFGNPELTKEELNRCKNAWEDASPQNDISNNGLEEEHNICINKKKCNGVDYVNTVEETKDSFVCGQNFNMFMTDLVNRFSIKGDYCKAASVLGNTDIPVNSKDQNSDTLPSQEWETVVEKNREEFQKFYNNSQKLQINFDLENEDYFGSDRVSLSQVKVELMNDGETVSTKKGVYGASGTTELEGQGTGSGTDTGMVRNIQLLDPGDQFHETYDVETTFRSYRGWTGRETPGDSMSLLGDAIQKSVIEQGLESSEQTFVSDIFSPSNQQTVQCVYESEEGSETVEEFESELETSRIGVIEEKCGVEGINKEDIVNITTDQRKYGSNNFYMTIKNSDVRTSTWSETMDIESSTMERCLSNWEDCFYPGSENLANAGMGPEEHSEEFKETLGRSRYTNNPEIVEEKEITVGETGIVGSGSEVSFDSEDRPVVITNTVSSDKLHYSTAEYLGLSGGNHEFRLTGCNPNPETDSCQGSMNVDYAVFSPKRLKKVEGFEAGIVDKPATTTDHAGNLVEIHFKDSYDDPMVLTTVQTANGGQEPRVVNVEEINKDEGTATIEFCEPFGSDDYELTSGETRYYDRCDSHGSEEIGYIVVDRTKLENIGTTVNYFRTIENDFPIFGGTERIQSSKRADDIDTDKDGVRDAKDCKPNDPDYAQYFSGHGCGSCPYGSSESHGKGHDTGYCYDGHGNKISSKCYDDDWGSGGDDLSWSGCFKPKESYKNNDRMENSVSLGDYIRTGSSYRPVFLTDLQTEDGTDESTIAMADMKESNPYLYHIKFCEVEKGSEGADGYPADFDNLQCNIHTDETLAWLAIPRFSGTQEITARTYEYADDGDTYDGASAEKVEDTGDIKVFKDCGKDDSWLVGNNPGDMDNFLCVTENMSQEYYDQPYSRTKAYNCFDEEDIKSRAYQREYIDYMEPSEENHTYYFDGDYYTCKEEQEEWVVDTVEPTIRCEDCISKQEAEVNERIDITPEIEDHESGVELYQVCTDQECSDVIGEDSNCHGDRCEEKTFQFASDEHTRTNLFVKATDRQGNTETENIGYIETRKEVGEYCETDDVCISGNCADSGEYENTCRPPNEPPEVDITD